MSPPSSDFERVVEALAEGVVIHAADGSILRFNQTALEVLGLTADQMSGLQDIDPRWKLLRADFSELPESEIPSVEARVTGKPVVRRRLAVRLANGTYRELVVSAMPLRNAQGEIERVVAAFLDITRELAVVNELRVFERFFELSTDLLVVYTADQRVVQINDAVATTLGFPRERYYGKGLQALVHPDDLAHTLAVDVEGAQEFTNRLMTATGGWRTITWRLVKAQHDHLGVTFFARGHDVTERVAELSELHRTRQLLTEGFEIAELAVLERDLVAGTTRATTRLKALLQLPPDASEDVRLADYVVPEDLARYQAYREKIELGALLPPHALRLKTAQGEIREVRKWIQLTRDETGRITRELTVVQDVTQQSLLQAQLRLAERLTSLGTMAAGVAHEINNPLAFVLANLNVVRNELAKIEHAPNVDLVDLRDAVNEALEGAERVRQIVLSLKPFARVDEHQRGLCDVARIVQASLNMAKNELRHRARIVSELRQVGPVFANEARLGQVFLNLLVNAAHAMPDGRAAENLVTIITREEAGQVVVTVSDTGTGIPAAVLPRIFDPFFSTKQIGEGTGLGLFISQGIVKEVGGFINVTSTPGVGTTFEVRLPIAPTGYTGTSTTPVPARSRARVLLVDDEAPILRSLERLLGKSHDLTLAHSGREALALLSAGLEYDLVICDLMMPEVSGIDVWEQLTPAQRQIFVVMTGGTFTERAERFLAEAKPAVLEKPFTATTLEGLLKRAQSR